MSIFIFDPSCLRKLANVEGPGWGMEQENHLLVARKTKTPLHVNTYFGAVFEFVRGEQPVIYGYGGFNRYVVRDDGRVAFLRVQAAYPAMIERAKTEGFDLE